MVTLQSCCMALTLAASLLIYLNTLPAGFAFDDNFAVVRVPIGHLAYLCCSAKNTLPRLPVPHTLNHARPCRSIMGT